MSFGALAAERERDSLTSFFVESVAYRRLQEAKKIIALGNRGSGKTAVLSMIADQAKSKGNVVVELAPEDFAYELLTDALSPEREGAWSKQGAYAAAWKYLLYILAMKAIMRETPGLKTGASKRIFAYLRDHQANVDVNPLEALISYLKRLEGVKVGKFEASLKARELHRLYRLEDIEGLLDDLDELARQRPIILLIDELDQGWDASEDAVAFVAGLFQAGTSIGVRTPHVRVVMSLRRELYENIPSLYEDAQKVRDTIEVIEWTPQRLLDLITRRIAVSLGDHGAPPLELWERIFGSRIDDRPSLDYLLDLTLLRPRELIQLCSQVRDVAADRDERVPVSQSSVKTAQALYADDRFSDLMAEYRFQFPGLASVIETFRGRLRDMDRDDLELHCLRLAVGELRVTPDAAWIGTMDSDQIIDVLWRIGFLLCDVSPTVGEPNFVGAHQVRTVNLRSVSWFRMHSMFATYLDCN